MKRIVFWVLTIISLILAVRIGKILIFDFNRLTDYGAGYLTGLIVLFVISLSLIILLGRKLFKKDRQPEN